MIAGTTHAQPVCGNGVVEPPEQCDDGNLLAGDCCAPDCTITNLPPLCDGAFATPDYLWPPNHKMVPVGIDGVVDPDGGPLAIKVTAIAQDEPVGGSCPNGVGLGLDGPSLRTERDGSGDGRVYHVAFEAVDVCGAPCMGEVTICVPHDQGNGSVCVDGGAIYDATFCGAAPCDGSDCDASACVPDPDEVGECHDDRVPASVTARLHRAEKLIANAGKGKGKGRARAASRLLAKAARRTMHAADRGHLSDDCAKALVRAIDDADDCSCRGDDDQGDDNDDQGDDH